MLNIETASCNIGILYVNTKNSIKPNIKINQEKKYRELKSLFTLIYFGITKITIIQGIIIEHNKPPIVEFIKPPRKNLPLINEIKIVMMDQKTNNIRYLKGVLL